MRIHEIITEADLDEDLASIKKKVSTAVMGGALAAAGVHMATKPSEPEYSWGHPLSANELSRIEKSAGDLGMTVDYEVEGDGGEDETPSKAADGGKEAAAPQTAKMSKAEKEAYLMALTMWGEARSHGPDGMRAVGHVIMNRVFKHNAKKFGNGIIGVVWKRKQFSCWNPGDPNRDAMREITQLPKDGLEYKRWVQARKLAKAIIAGKLKDTTGGSLWYHTTGVAPIWAKAMNPIKKIANHLFYKVTA